MEVPGAQLYNGRSLQQYTWNNSGAQKWYLLPNHIIDGEIYYVFRSSLSDQYVIDVYDQPYNITTSNACRNL